jgi:hypothetical protein
MLFLSIDLSYSFAVSRAKTSLGVLSRPRTAGRAGLLPAHLLILFCLFYENVLEI